MRIIRALLYIIPLTGLLLTQSGCLLAVAAVGTGATVAYVKGDSEILVEADPKQIADATDKAMKDLDMAVISNRATDLDAKIIGRTAGDTKLEVTVKSHLPRLSKVYIRAGVFGDEFLQSRLLEKIKSNLPEAPKTLAKTPTTAPAMTSAHAAEEDSRD